MKKSYLPIIALFFSIASFAQKGNNQLSIGVEADLPIGQLGDAYGVGFGGSIKGLYGIGTKGLLTLTTGYSSFSGKSGTLYDGQTFTMIPIMAGYRHLLNGGLYVEPQAGVTINNTKIPNFNFSETKFGAALNLGYVTAGGFDASIRYLTEGDVLSMLALRLAYNIRLASHAK